MLGQNVAQNQVYANSMGMLQRGYGQHDPGLIRPPLQSYTTMGQHPSLQHLQQQAVNQQQQQQNQIGAHPKPRTSTIVPHKMAPNYYHKQSQQQQTPYQQQMVTTSNSSHMTASAADLTRPSSNANQHGMTHSPNQPHAMDYSSAQHHLSQTSHTQTSHSQSAHSQASRSQSSLAQSSQAQDSSSMYGMISEPHMAGTAQHLPPGRYVPQKSMPMNQKQPQPAHSKAIQQKARDLPSQMSLDHRPPALTGPAMLNNSQPEPDPGKNVHMPGPIRRPGPRPAVSHVPFKMDSMRKSKEQEQLMKQQHQVLPSPHQPAPVTSMSGPAGPVNTNTNSRRGAAASSNPPSQPTAQAGKKPPTSGIVPFKMDAMRKAAAQKNQAGKSQASANIIPPSSQNQSANTGQSLPQSSGLSTAIYYQAEFYCVHQCTVMLSF